jgi:hypothetical protein
MHRLQALVSAAVRLRWKSAAGDEVALYMIEHARVAAIAAHGVIHGHVLGWDNLRFDRLHSRWRMLFVEETVLESFGRVIRIRIVTLYPREQTPEATRAHRVLSWSNCIQT